jgi:hypothetical protein
MLHRRKEDYTELPIGKDTEASGQAAVAYLKALFQQMSTGIRKYHEEQRRGLISGRKSKLCDDNLS